MFGPPLAVAVCTSATHLPSRDRYGYQSYAVLPDVGRETHLSSEHERFDLCKGYDRASSRTDLTRV